VPPDFFQAGAPFGKRLMLALALLTTAGERLVDPHAQSKRSIRHGGQPADVSQFRLRLLQRGFASFRSAFSTCNASLTVLSS